MEQVSVIGVGEIGSRMARRLIRHGFEVTVYDIVPEATTALAAEGARVAHSAAEAAAHSAIIITCVTDPKAVERAVIGRGGVAEGARRGSVLIETTTSTPATTRTIAVVLKDKDVDVIDAPVSRGVPAAENGTLSILVGGDRQVMERCMPVLSRLGTDILHVGELGFGHIVKAVNMLMLASNLIAAAEVVGLGVHAGLNRQKMLEVLNVSSGESFMTSNHYMKYVLTGTFDSQFTLGLMYKDIQIGLQIAAELGIPALAATRVKEIYAIANRHGMAAEDNTRIVPWLERWMGQPSV